MKNSFDAWSCTSWDGSLDVSRLVRRGLLFPSCRCRTGRLSTGRYSPLEEGTGEKNCRRGILRFFWSFLVIQWYTFCSFFPCSSDRRCCYRPTGSRPNVPHENRKFNNIYHYSISSARRHKISYPPAPMISVQMKLMVSASGAQPFSLLNSKP